MLSFTEAQLFARAGFDVRHSSWPPGDFLRFVVGEVSANDGFETQVYVVRPEETAGKGWYLA